MVNEQSDLYSRILQARNINSEELSQSLEDLPDEALFANIDALEARIHKAIFANEPLLIFGHDDPDGITSTYILYHYLNSCGYQRHSYYIPNRNIESHGIQERFIRFAVEGGYKLVITVDNGISAFAGVEALNANGIDVIITDHHLVQPELIPNAYSILNPQLADCRYPFKSLAGVGVVLMLIRYLAKQWEHPIDNASYLWAAVGSMADKVPMQGLNRLIVRHVIDHFEEVQDHTVQFLLRNYNRVSSPSDVFNFLSYVSRLIANGREEGGNHTALRFILQLSNAKAQLFEDLEKQKNQWENELNRVFAFLETLATDFVGKTFVYFDDDDVIPYSLLGTASTFIVNRLGIPTIMLKQHNGLTVCEGRCGDGFNMVDAFSHCKEHLTQFGGHAKAAGFTMQPGSYDAFLECFNEYLSQNFSPPETAGGLAFDTTASLAELTPENWQKIEALLPWGQQNPEPVLKIEGLKQANMGSFSLDAASLSLPREQAVDCLVNWRAPAQLRIIKKLS